MQKAKNTINSEGFKALSSYAQVLAAITAQGSSSPQPAAIAELLHINGSAGLNQLYRSLSAVAPAVPGARNEEWNPLSQRPHAPLPPVVGDELGGEITSLKEAIEAFATLSHEMMHVALWEPFFAGQWRPSSRRAFREFSLLSEGFCFFFTDIHVSGAIRVRLPDGEFALERHAPSNARFHPSRAFKSLGITDPAAILDIYLGGFSGQKTGLWQPRGTNDYAAAMAAQVYAFYAGTQGYLDELHDAISAFGGLAEFYQRFCRIGGLPSLIGKEAARLAAASDRKPYFTSFFQDVLPAMAQLTPAQVDAVRWRRMLQTRAYFALQVRWLLTEGLVIAQNWRAPTSHKLVLQIDSYLDELHKLLVQLARFPDSSPVDALNVLDNHYDAHVRSVFLSHSAWVGHRWLIAPRRAGGSISAFAHSPATAREGTIQLLQTVAFLVDELTWRMRESKTIAERVDLLAEIQRLAALGAKAGSTTLTQARSAAKALGLDLRRPLILESWSVPIASFDPRANMYRELLFSYQ